jgi:hypothetical protein
MIPEYFALVGSLIASTGGFYYLYCTIKGTVQPNRMTWFFWGAFPMIAFAAQMAQGVELIAWATFVAGLTPFLIVIASYFNPKAYWQIQKTDYLFALIAIIGVVLWQVTDNPNVALTFALLADFAVALPTIVKSFTNPETESPLAYALSTFGLLIAMSAIQDWSYESGAFVVYLAAINGFIALLLVRRSA